MRVGGWVFLALLLVVPFLNFVHLPTLDSFVENALSMLLVAAALPVVLLAVPERFGIGRFSACLAALFGGLLLIGLLSDKAWPSALRLFCLFALVLVAVAWLAEQWSASLGVTQYYRALSWALVVGGLLQAVGAIAVHYWLCWDVLGDWMGMPGPRMSGLISQANLLGLYIFCALVTLLYLRFRADCSRSFVLFVGVLFGFVLAGTGSRALLLDGGLMLFGLLLIKRKGALAWSLLECGVAVLIGGGLFFWLDPILMSHLIEQGFAPPGFDASAQWGRALGGEGLNYRLSELHKAWLLLLQHPLTGIGLGRYGVESFWMGVDYPWALVDSNFPMHSHNLFAQIGAEFGAVGLLLLGIFIGVFVRFWRREGGGQEAFLAYGVGSAFVVNSMLEYVLWNVEFAILLILCLAPLCGRFTFGGLSRSAKVTLSSVWLAASVGLALFTWSLYSLVLQVRMGVDSFIVPSLREAGNDSLFGEEMLLLQIYRMPLDQFNLDYEDEISRRLMQWRPYNLVLLRRMHLLALRGDDVAAMDLARVFVRMYPADIGKVRDFFSELRQQQSNSVVDALAVYFHGAG